MHQAIAFIHFLSIIAWWMVGHYDGLLAEIHGKFCDIAPIYAINWPNTWLLNDNFNKS